MSSVNASTTQSSSPEKKVRAPALSEKYSKFIQFSYYMMSQMSETETFTKEEFLNQVQMFATVEEQQTFIQGFFDNQKDNKKSMRKNLQDKKKANQPKKVRAPRKTKKAATDEPTQEADSTTNTESQENLIESLTEELIEEPMINKISAAIEIAEDMTAKKPREKKAAGAGEKKAAGAGEKKARVIKKKVVNEAEPTTTAKDGTPIMNSP